LAKKWLIITHISAEKSVVRKKCIGISLKIQGKIALNLAQKWLIFAQIQAKKVLSDHFFFLSNTITHH